MRRVEKRLHIGPRDRRAARGIALRSAERTVRRRSGGASGRRASKRHGTADDCRNDVERASILVGKEGVDDAAIADNCGAGTVALERGRKVKVDDEHELRVGENAVCDIGALESGVGEDDDRRLAAPELGTNPLALRVGDIRVVHERRPGGLTQIASESVGGGLVVEKNGDLLVALIDRVLEHLSQRGALGDVRTGVENFAYCAALQHCWRRRGRWQQRGVVVVVLLIGRHYHWFRG